MIEVIKVGRVVKFDKEKKIIFFYDPNLMKASKMNFYNELEYLHEQLANAFGMPRQYMGTHSRSVVTNPCNEIPLPAKECIKFDMEYLGKFDDA